MVTKTVVSSHSLNDGDVFVLAGGPSNVVFVWNGTYARQAERTKGASFGARLADEEMGELVIMEKGSEHAAFWDVLGDRTVVRSAAEGGDDDEVARREMARRRLYRVADSTGAAPALVPVNVDTTFLSRHLLEPASVFLLDIVEEVFVWAGERATSAHKSFAVQRAEAIVSERPPHVDLSWVLDGDERAFFREQFVRWDSDAADAQPVVAKRVTYELQLSDAPSLAAAAAPSDPVKLAVVKFNSKPADGVQWAIKQKLCRRNAKDVARFLWQAPNVNKASLGDYLAERDAFNQQVLAEFAQFIDLHNMDFDTALRAYLQCFRMPGEAQKIE